MVTKKVEPTKASSKSKTSSKAKPSSKTPATRVNGGKYGLYHTLNTIPKKKDLTVTQKKKLVAKIGEMDEQRRVAVMMLIFEHATASEVQMMKGNKVRLPYGMKQSSSDVVIDLEEVPVELRIILWKFSQIV